MDELETVNIVTEMFHTELSRPEKNTKFNHLKSIQGGLG